MRHNPDPSEPPLGLKPLDIELDDSKLENGLDVGYSTYRLTKYPKVGAEQWYEVKWATGSDYSGGDVTLANYRSLREMLAEAFPGEGPVAWLVGSGGHGTYSIMVRWAALPDEIKETLRHLDDYPVIDEQELGEVDNERENEAWEDWGRSDFERAFLEAWNARWPDDDEVEEWPATVGDDDTYQMFRIGMMLANEYWEHGEGDAVSIRFERIAGKVTELLSGGAVPRWMSPDDTNMMLDVAKSFGMEPTITEREHRGQLRLPCVKNSGIAVESDPHAPLRIFIRSGSRYATGRVLGVPKDPRDVQVFDYTGSWTREERDEINSKAAALLRRQGWFGV